MPPRGAKKGGGGGEEVTDDARLRIAIVNSDRCKPKKCRQECKRNCPVNRTGKLCIEVETTDKVAFISEPLCIGCGICVKKCPFEAITIINLPKDLSKDTTHRFGPNTFKLHRLPVPRPGQILGLVGTNGIGKSTALRILAGQLKPNLGRFEPGAAPDWQGVLQFFRGSELQGYFQRIIEDTLHATVKPQYVDRIPKAVSGTVASILAKKDELDRRHHFAEELQLSHLMDRQVQDLSGGELQRFAIAVVCVSASTVFMFDEPSSYLDVRQRIKVAQVIRSLMSHDNYIIVVEHDLSVLDYLSDFVCCLWGSPSVYGVVTSPFSVREGINIFLDGFIPTENLRCRDTSLTFKVADAQEEPDQIKRLHSTPYPALLKRLGTFNLKVESGQFSDSEIIVMLGENGTGKSTFIKMLAGMLAPDKELLDDEDEDGDGENGGTGTPTRMPTLHVSYKPQIVSAKFEGSVKNLFLAKIRDAFLHPQFQADVIKPLNIDHILDQEVQVLSGGEIQRVALIVALGKPADLYLIDEPSAYLDSEQRIAAAKVIKRFILHAKKTAFVVEHDFIMATYLADKVIVYEGSPGVDCLARSPEPLIQGMNRFLKALDITFRRDPSNYRPRINKHESVKDKDQKLSGQYFVADGD